jgi:hypothetical protein
MVDDRRGVDVVSAANEMDEDVDRGLPGMWDRIAELVQPWIS